MELSIFLGKVIGLYLLIVSVIMTINRKDYKKLLQSFQENFALTLVCGVFTVILGLLLVVGHNIWRNDWRVIITLIAWLTLAKGIGLILVPLKILTFKGGSGTFLLKLLVSFLLGAYLSYVAFFREA